MGRRPAGVDVDRQTAFECELCIRFRSAPPTRRVARMRFVRPLEYIVGVANTPARGFVRLDGGDGDAVPVRIYHESSTDLHGVVKRSHMPDTVFVATYTKVAGIRLLDRVEPTT